MNFDVIYSNRKTVCIKVKEGKVIVRAPMGISVSELKDIVIKHSDWIKKSISKEKESCEKMPSLTDSEIKALKKSARTYFNEKCKYYSEIMGLSYNKITITSAKTRFGSCSSKKNISFSYLLMQYPEEAREYVVVHELAHLKEMNHSAKFYAIVSTYMPDYKNRKKLLKNK